MAGLNSQMVLDTSFLERFSQLPDELAKAARRAVVKTNRWLRAVSMADLGYELAIDSRAMKTRFRIYKNGRTSKLWVGVREIGVHRLGNAEQMRGGVKVGDQFYEDAFISPMHGSELVVWQRTGVVKLNRWGKTFAAFRKVTLDIADEAQEIIESYQSDLNRKFEENFHREFQYVLSRA